MSVDWNVIGPSPEALLALSQVADEDEFPGGYSGCAWRAAYRIWKACKDDPSKLNVGPYEDIPGVDLDNLGLSGFMYGWALNAVRQMLGKSPGPNPAIVTFGEREEPAYPSVGSAEEDMKRAIGGAKVQ